MIQLKNICCFQFLRSSVIRLCQKVKSYQISSSFPRSCPISFRQTINFFTRSKLLSSMAMRKSRIFLSFHIFIFCFIACLFVDVEPKSEERERNITYKTNECSQYEVLAGFNEFQEAGLKYHSDDLPHN